MAQVLVRNIPDDVVKRLKAKAASRNTSLEQYLRDMIEREVKPDRAATLDVLRKLRAAQPVADFDIVAAIREGRVRRDRPILGAPFDDGP